MDFEVRCQPPVKVSLYTPESIRAQSHVALDTIRIVTLIDCQQPTLFKMGEAKECR